MQRTQPGLPAQVQMVITAAEILLNIRTFLISNNVQFLLMEFDSLPFPQHLMPLQIQYIYCFTTKNKNKKNSQSSLCSQKEGEKVAKYSLQTCFHATSWGQIQQVFEQIGRGTGSCDGCSCQQSPISALVFDSPVVLLIWSPCDSQNKEVLSRPVLFIRAGLSPRSTEASPGMRSAGGTRHCPPACTAPAAAFI